MVGFRGDQLPQSFLYGWHMEDKDEKWLDELYDLEEQAEGAFCCLPPMRNSIYSVLMGSHLLTEFHFDLTGKIFGSAMPFGLYDPDGQLLSALKSVSVPWSYSLRT